MKTAPELIRKEPVESSESLAACATREGELLMILGGIRESKKQEFRSPSPKGSAEFETGVASLPLETGKSG
jgi:hypothetical protein